MLTTYTTECLLKAWCGGVLTLCLFSLSGADTPPLSPVQPHNYTLKLTIYLQPPVLVGYTDVRFDLLEPSPNIVLHAQRLDIKQVQLYSGRRRDSCRVTFKQQDDDILVIEKSSSFDRDAYFLRIQYTTVLKKELEGIYLTSYRDKAGSTHQIVATHFEPTHARKAFPCFDEPNLKATFTLSIDHEAVYRAISNMPVKSRVTTTTGRVQTSFMTTRRMSTYLVAFTLNNWEFLEAQTRRGVRVRAYHRPELPGQAQQGLHILKQGVEFFEGYLLQVYPLPKLDIVPLPDFGIGAMENWGMITIRENMFYTDNTTRLKDVMLMRAIVMHEVAHMWFGDLVSIESWNDLWIKEGMSQVLMFVGLEILSENKENGFTRKDLQDALYMFEPQVPLRMDSTRQTHAVKFNVSGGAEVASAFDAISYDKSLTLLRALRNLMGDDAFQSGLSRFIRSYKLGTASLEQLLLQLNEAGTISSRLSVSDYMVPWLTKPGYPLIDVEFISPRRYRIRQSRYVEEPGYNYKTFDTTLWPVVITLTTKRGKPHKILLRKRSRVLAFSFDPVYVKLNVNNTLYFRTNYDPPSLRALQSQLEEDMTVFTEQDRLNMVSDVLSMIRSNKIDIRYSLDFLRYLQLEDSFIVWMEALSKLAQLKKCLTDTTSVLFIRYMQSIMETTLQKVSNKTDADEMLGQLFRKYAMEFGMKEKLFNVKEEYLEWRNNGGKVSYEAVLYAILYMGHGEQYKVWQKLSATSFPQNLQLAKALAASTNTSIIISLLRGSLEDNWVPLQNIYEILLAVSRYHPSTALSFLMENYSRYLELYGDSQFNFSNLIGGVVGNIKDSDDYNKSKAFFRNVNLGSANQAYNVAVSNVASLLQWRDCCENKMYLYLIENYSS